MLANLSYEFYLTDSFDLFLSVFFFYNKMFEYEIQIDIKKFLHDFYKLYIFIYE